MTGVLMWLLQAVSILAMAFLLIILLVLVCGIVFAIVAGLLGEWNGEDGDGDA